MGRPIQALVIGIMLLVGNGFAARAQQHEKGWLGVELKDLTKEDADALGWESPHGAKVVKLLPGSPAEKAGILPNDILNLLDGMEVENMTAFTAAVDGKAPNTEIKIRILRGGKERRLSVILASPPVQSAHAEPKQVPLLQLDTGGHMALIRALSFTPDGKFIVSAGDDKVIRVWDWQRGELARTIRGQSRVGAEGKIYAMVLSPDGRWLAVGGWMHPECPGRCGDIRLYDFASGELKGLLKGHDNTVYGLAFSPDSKLLISGSFDRDAILWDIGPLSAANSTEAKLLHRLKGHRDEIFAVGFTPDGKRAVTGSYDTTLRLWSVADGALLKEMTGHGDKLFAAAVSPKDGRIASGDKSGEIRIWDGTTGAFLNVLAQQGGVVGSLHFSPDGRLLLSTCGYSGCNHTQKILDAFSGKELTAYSQHDSIVLASAFSPDGRLTATAGGEQYPIEVWDPITGETKRALKGAGQPIWAAGFSPDGKSIGWGATVRSGWTANDKGPLEMALRLPSAGESLPAPIPIASDALWQRAKASLGNLSLQHRKGGTYGYDAILDILKDGKAVASIEVGAPDGYGHNTYSFSPDGKAVISGGSNGALIAYNLEGKRIGNFEGHEGEVWAVAASPDGRYLVSSSADLTVRLWNLKTRELIVTLFPGADGEWVMWTPQGYYAGSPGADKIVGWQINKGPGKAADYVTAERLREFLYKPEIVAKAIVLASAEEAIKQTPGTNRRLEDLLAIERPRFTLKVEPRVSGGVAPLTVALEPSKDPLHTISLDVNGVSIPIDKQALLNSAGRAPQTIPIPLARGRNVIRVSVSNGGGETSKTVEIVNSGEGALDKRGTLYVLAVGVSDYRGLGTTCGERGTMPCTLPFAARNAKDFAEFAVARLKLSHQNPPVVRVMVNGAGADLEPTAANIKNQLGLFRRAQANDTVVLFIHGHGGKETRLGSYRFYASDARLDEGGEVMDSTVVPWSDIDLAMNGAYGRKLMFVDTCFSKNGFNEQLGNKAYYANVVAYFSASPNQVGYWTDEAGGSLFAAASIDGFNGGAKAPITTDGLAGYMRRHLQELVDDMKQKRQLQGEIRQDLQYVLGRDATDFLLAAGE